MNDSTFTQLDNRAAQLFEAIQIGQAAPTSDVFGELAELTIALEDKPARPVVVARLTVTRAVGNLTIIEVWQDATFSNFYRIFTQNGRRRSTKTLVRTANRNEGIQPYYCAHQAAPGMERLAEQWQARPHVSAVKIRIIKKRAYRKLISARPDELGLTTTTRSRLPLQNFPLY